MQDPSLYSQIKAQIDQPQFPEQEHLKCPRCDSANTKFCYYNNYNLSQPRHFCKSCKRYWTKGGALRNIPVGGASRKSTKRNSSSSSSSSSTTTTKRPVPAASQPPSNSSNIDGKSNNGETLPVIGENFEGQFGKLMEVRGSFSSLLSSNGGQFSNFVGVMESNGSNMQISGDPDPGQDGNPPRHIELESGGSNNGDEFLNIQGSGDTGCWTGDSNGWPGLSIYTPGSTFQ